MNPKHTAAFLTISLIWGSMWLIQQNIPDPASQLHFTATALAVSAITLAIIAACLRLPLPAKRECIASAVLGITLIAVPYLLAIWTLPHLSSGIPAVVAAATPLLAGFLCDTPWSARNASIAGLGGVLLVVGSIISPSLDQLPWTLAMLAGVFLIAASLVFAKKQLEKCHPVYTAMIQLAVASVILGMLDFARGTSPSSGQSWTLILSAAAGNAIASVLYFWLLQRLRVDLLTATVWLQLLVSVAESIILLRPHIDWRILFGTAVIIGSLLALASSKRDEPVLTVGVT